MEVVWTPEVYERSVLAGFAESKRGIGVCGKRDFPISMCTSPGFEN